MAPHAGYVYSGAIAAQDSCPGRARIPGHTARSQPYGPRRGSIRLARRILDLSRRLLAGGYGTGAGTARGGTGFYSGNNRTPPRTFAGSAGSPCWLPSIRNAVSSPITIAERNLERLLAVGHSLAQVISGWNEPVTILVSSDMNHFLSHEETVRKDRMALEAIEQLDPELLFRTVRENSISMCGVYPMTMGLAACRDLGASEAVVTAYSTSAKASGDYSRVVGYAGAVVR